MKIVSIFANYDNAKYTLNKTFGLLLMNNNVKFINYSDKVESALAKVLNPYKLSPLKTLKKEKTKLNKTFITILVKTYTFFCLKSFLFVRLLSFVRFPIFNSTDDAINYYRKFYPNRQQDLCLPRTLFAATTSKSFKKMGFCLLGCFYLARECMHG